MPATIEEIGNFMSVGGEVHSIGSIKHERNGKIVGRHCTVASAPSDGAFPPGLAGAGRGHPMPMTGP